jgi:DNA-binding NtrC family response regulator
MNAGKILIVDDNPNVCSALELLLQEEFSTVETATSPEGIPEKLAVTPFDVVLLDMNYTSGQQSGTEGMFWLDRILEASPTISVIMLTAYGDVELAVRALKRGAVDFVLKPWENEKLLATVRTAVRLSQTTQEVKDLRATERLLRNELRNEPCLVVGESPAFKDVLDTVRKVAGTDANVLITGENGTGKEVIAREIHRLSHRSNQLMVTVDMGAVSETLFESELFGHVRGAFTDARNDRAGGSRWPARAPCSSMRLATCP